MKKLLFILLSIQLAFASSPQQLTSGETINQTVKKTEKQFYKITVPKNKSIHVNLTELEADIDLYIKKGNEVRLRFNDCYSSNSNTQDEECILTNEGETSEYSILVYGYQESSYTLKTTINGAENIPTLTDSAIQDDVAHKKSKHYKLTGEKGRSITITLSDLTADADLRVKVGQKASLHSFDCKSTNGGTKTDECTITPKKDGTVYIQVYGYKAASYSIKKTVKSNNTNQELIEIAKEHCLHKKNGTDKILCSEEENIVYLLTTDSPEFVHGSLNFTYHKHYRISIAPSKEKVTLIDEYKYEQYMHSTQTFHAKLKDTPLYFINHQRKNVDTIGHVALYYQDKVLKKFYYNDLRYAPTEILRNMKTFDNGKRLSLQYDRINDNPATTYTEIYDISNPSNIKLIKTIKKNMF